MSLTDYIRSMIFINEVEDNDGNDFDDLCVDIPLGDIQIPDRKQDEDKEKNTY